MINLFDMKNTFYLLIAFVFISACEIIDYDYDTYTIKNETKYTINIMAYDKYYNNGEDLVAVERTPIILSDDITIESYDNYYVEKATGEVESPRGAFTREYVDSVIITFKNSKRATYVCNKIYLACFDEPRSIINLDLYESRKIENRGIDYAYTITQEDYDNAELIE